MSQTLGVVVPYSPEYRGDATDNGLLTRLAALTEGRALGFADPKAAFEHNLQGVRSTTDLWPLLLLLAILLFPFDIGVRRVRVTRADLADWGAEIRRRLGLAPRQAGAGGVGQATPEIAAMMGAKQGALEGQPTTDDRRPTTDSGQGGRRGGGAAGAFVGGGVGEAGGDTACFREAAGAGCASRWVEQATAESEEEIAGY